MAKLTLAALPLALLTPSAISEPVPEWPDLEPTNVWGLTVADFDGDGTGDVLVNNHRDGFPEPLPDWHDLLLVSDGNTWRVELELPYADRHGCTALDADDDGRLDFFCAVGAEKGLGVGPNELWLQEADGWVEVGADWGIDNPTARGRHAGTVDWNSDGLDDLFVGVAPDPDEDSRGAVWLNRGGRFEPVPVEQYGTDCAVPWRGGIVVCDVGPRLGTTAWWLRPDAEPVDLGEYFDAAIAGERLVLVATDHVTIDGERIELPRAAHAATVRPNVSANGDSVYLMAATGGCVEYAPDILVRWDGQAWITSDAPDGTCTLASGMLNEYVLVGEPGGVELRAIA